MLPSHQCQLLSVPLVTSSFNSNRKDERVKYEPNRLIVSAKLAWLFLGKFNRAL